MNVRSLQVASLRSKPRCRDFKIRGAIVATAVFVVVDPEIVAQDFLRLNHGNYRDNVFHRFGAVAALNVSVKVQGDERLRCRSVGICRCVRHRAPIIRHGVAGVNKKVDISRIYFHLPLSPRLRYDTSHDSPIKERTEVLGCPSSPTCGTSQDEPLTTESDTRRHRESAPGFRRQFPCRIAHNREGEQGRQGRLRQGRKRRIMARIKIANWGQVAVLQGRPRPTAVDQSAQNFAS